MTAPREVAIAQLEKANEVRSRRGRLKLLIAEGRIPVSEVLVREKQFLRNMKVHDLLLATPGLGKVKVDRAFRSLRIPHNTTLAGLSVERKEQLLDWLKEHHGVKI
ncbi:MAG TPA: hypothetical protein VFJ76_07855 [Solirubrobacterales bacterium]|nr:hypothetical protein [Solirubrobacterales bacterium]